MATRIVPAAFEAMADNGPMSSGGALSLRPDILVRGTGAVGLAAALALARQGLRVSLLGAWAQASSAQPDIRAYALNRASVQLLAELKVWEAIPEAARTPVHEMRVEGDQPDAVLEFSAWQATLAELAWIVDAAALDAALGNAVRFAPHIERLAAGVAEPASAALTVLAEGKDSATRAALGATLERSAYGQKAIAARLATTRAHAGLARQWFRSPDVLALLPTDEPRRDHGLALVWSLPDERADALLALPDAAFEAELMGATAGAAGELRLTSGRAAWPLAVGAAEPLFGAGWVLVGDAAHVVHPLAGQGLNLGLADVASLARVIAEREPWREIGDPRLLARHARARAADTLAMSGVTDGLLHLFAHPAPWAKQLRNRGLNLVNRLAPLKRALTHAALGAPLEPRP
jgi:2-polyprenyl-6-methoxyphenol hydroxylase-like FAD-dependent oxidoreductase